jgi:hypothetical protein
MITWADKVAFVGLTVKAVPSSISKGIGYPYRVKLCYNPGLCSFGDGHTIDEAIKDAAISMPIDWTSVERKITELEWQRMSHV